MRIALSIEYEGTQYAGWQRQPNAPHVSTVQDKLEKALSLIADHPVTAICAGRTDRGVHAKGQVAHFDTESTRPIDAWILGTNTKLPSDICVRFAKQVADDFHARFSALARHYCYVIDTRSVRSALLRNHVTWHPYVLDVSLMNEAGQYLIGEHDFSAYRSQHCQSSSTLRNVHHVNVTREDHFIKIDIKANAFLHNMVRNIVGVLMVIGAGKASPNWARHVLDSKDRRQAADTASPTGLYLMAVEYPVEFNVEVK